MAETKTIPMKMLTKLAKKNAQNKTGYLDYNKFGRRDGKGFQQCSDKFVDNFLLQILVPEYLINDKNNYRELGNVNRTIRGLLSDHGLQKIGGVKGIALRPCGKKVKENLKEKILYRKKHLETENTRYFWQEYKVSCDNENYSDVMQYVRSQKYMEDNIFLKDIDITIDYAGSFEKEEVMTHMINTEGFKLQGTNETGERTILDNSHYVGRNCLVYMDTLASGCTIRCKIYNKYVQSLETKSVRSSLGNHWRDWVDQRRPDVDTGERVNTRLAVARDRAVDRGLTRAEVTFYCGDDVPTDVEMERALLDITQYVPPSLVFITPYAAAWKAYCDSLLHSLILVYKDKQQKETAFIIYSYNEVTDRLSGNSITNWNREWCLANLTFSADLPIDIIEVNTMDILDTADDKTIQKYNITMKRWIKEHTNGGQFTTRLVPFGGMYTHSDLGEEKCKKQLQLAGFLPHQNCIPFLAWRRATSTSKSYLQLHFVMDLTPRIDMVIDKKEKKMIQTACKKANKNQALALIKKETEEKMGHIRQEISNKTHFGNICRQYKTARLVKLQHLKPGDYSVIAMKETVTQFGTKYVMLLDLGEKGGIAQCYPNKKVEECVGLVLPQHKRSLVSKDKVICLDTSPIGILTITGQGRTQFGNLFVYCTFVFSRNIWDIFSPIQVNGPDSKDKLEEKEEIADTADNSGQNDNKNISLQSQLQNTFPLIPRDEMVMYKQMPNLVSLPLHSVHTVKRFGFYNWFGQEKLVVELGDGVVYQAGNSVQEQIEKLHPGCKLVIEKTRMCQTSKKTFAVCRVVEEGNWAGLISYEQAPMYTKSKPQGGVAKVRDMCLVQHKGKKRKLVLTEDGNVYRIKAPKLEQQIRPGWILKL